MSFDPGVIKKLDEVVVNRIAAGEIIQRPANALKELLENSLDAKSSFIQVTVKNGGLKLLQIQDNGTGIRKEDLSIVCERFTTSKLSKFEDLSSIATFGFRGEALASISHVAHLTIQTKTANEICGYKASYEDGKLKGPAKACAGNQGTIITIEDLFFNMPQRRQAFKSPNEEFQRISDVMAKYAIHNSKVGFTLKKSGEQQNALKTPAESNQEQNINLIYGHQIAKELIRIEMKNSLYKYEMKGFITKPNYSAKKGIMLLFINHRLVESSALKSSIDGVYSTYLPKGMHPFIYISLNLDPRTLDVNVHPTKHEVHFLFEDEIVEQIKAHVEEKLLGSNETRSFYKQMKLAEIKDDPDHEEHSQRSQKLNPDKVHAKDMIRTDNKEQKLTKYMNTFDSGYSEISLSGSSSQGSANLSQNLDESFRVQAARKHKEVRLASILNMQKNLEHNCNVLLRKSLKEMVFVGVVDQTFALFQHETKLYLSNTPKLSEELFYQRLVYEFENLPQIRFEPSLSIKELIIIALNSEESGWTEEDGDKADLAESACGILIEKSGIMKQYYSLNISEDGKIESIPSLLPQYTPCITFLPLFLLRLATEVEWDSEEECFETFSRETARFYALTSHMDIESNPKKHKWLIEHVLYPAFKRFLLPPTRLKKHFYELTNLPTLYKVFERC